MRSSPQHLLSLPNGRGPLYQQIYQRIRTLILTGAWPTGTRLPSSRSLARDLGVSRTTALLALDQLAADGWITSRRGSGVYVSTDVPPARVAAVIDEGDAQVEDSRKPVPFEIAEPAVDLFPVGKWARIQSGVWSRNPEHALHEGSEAGWLPLRQAIASYLHAVRSLACSPDQIMIVSSTQAALDLCARVMARPAEAVWVEDPGYPGAREAFLLNGLRPVPVPVDHDGLQVAAAISLEPRARLAYVTPACQFPTCVPLSRERSAQLLDWAAGSDGFVLEDDWDYNTRFSDPFPAEPLAVLCPERVIHIHSFNRLLFPALRIAAVVVPRGLIGEFRDARRAIDRFPNVGNQIALAEFIEHGHLAAHLRVLRDAYLQRRTALFTSLEERTGGLIRPDSTRLGLHAIGWVARRSDSGLAAKLRQGGIACSTLSDFSTMQWQGQSALLLGYGAFVTQRLEDAVGRLASVLRS